MAFEDEVWRRYNDSEMITISKRDLGVLLKALLVIQHESKNNGCSMCEVFNDASTLALNQWRAVEKAIK